MGFLSDLKRQEPNVKKVSEHVGGTQIEGRFKQGDVLLEVKEDLQCYRTGNVCMEVAYNGEPSGVYAGSDFIVYKLGKHYWRAKTTDVIQHLEWHPEYRRLKGGDGKKSDLVLVPYWDFTQLFTLLFSE